MSQNQDLAITIRIPASHFTGTAQELLQHLQNVEQATVTIDGLLFTGTVERLTLR
jgi:hypothetical protein